MARINSNSNSSEAAPAGNSHFVRNPDGSGGFTSVQACGTPPGVLGVSVAISPMRSLVAASHIYSCY